MVDVVHPPFTPTSVNGLATSRIDCHAVTLRHASGEDSDWICLLLCRQEGVVPDVAGPGQLAVAADSVACASAEAIVGEYSVGSARAHVENPATAIEQVVRDGEV